MSLKVKLTSTICAFLLILGLVITGVFAVPQATVNLGGTLTFNATDVYAKVSGVIAGTASETQPTLETLEFNAGTTTDVSSWSNVPLTFTDAGSAITITVTIENQATDRPLYAKISDSIGEVEALTKSMKQGEAAYTGDVLELPASTGAGTSTATITLSIEVANKNASLTNASYGYAIDLSNEEIVEESIEVLYDQKNNYYYVEMGTYNGNPVRWRYISDVTNGIDTATGFMSLTGDKPNSAKGSKGMFILESEIFKASDIDGAATDTDDGILPYLANYSENNSKICNTAEGYTDILATDYAASDVRAFLNGTNNVAGTNVGNFMSVIGIDSSNEIYSKIVKRSLVDLYSSINDDGTALTVPTQFDSIKDTATDAFWIPSYQEAYTFIGCGMQNDEFFIWRSPAFVETGYYNAAQYWLRSPADTSGGYPYCVLDSGSIYYDFNTDFTNIAARPAFILEF